MIVVIVSVLLLKNFLIFLLGFMFAFFAIKISVLHRFALDRFGLFVCFFTTIHFLQFDFGSFTNQQPRDTYSIAVHFVMIRTVFVSSLLVRKNAQIELQK